MFQVYVTKPDGAIVAVGDPYQSLALAEMRAIELRASLELLPKSRDAVVTVEIVKEDRHHA